MFEEVWVDLLLVDEFEEGDVFEDEDFVALEVGTIRIVQFDDEVLTNFLGVDDLVVIGVRVWVWFGAGLDFCGPYAVDPGAGRVVCSAWQAATRRLFVNSHAQIIPRVSVVVKWGLLVIGLLFLAVHIVVGGLLFAQVIETGFITFHTGIGFGVGGAGGEVREGGRLVG